MSSSSADSIPSGKSKIEYKNMDQRSHVLHRPDMYIGSVRSRREEVSLACKLEDGSYAIRTAEIDNNPGLVRIFVEVLSNAIDNVWRSAEIISIAQAADAAVKLHAEGILDRGAVLESLDYSPQQIAGIA